MTEYQNFLKNCLNNQIAFMTTLKKNMKHIRISFVSDKNSWINNFIPKYISNINKTHHSINWLFNVDNLKDGDLCFFIGFHEIVNVKNLRKHKRNFVVHESDLPLGKGWSPLTWQIIENRSEIKISLIDVVEKVDSGNIIFQDVMTFEGHELIEELRAIQAKHTFILIDKVLGHENPFKIKGRKQKGKETFYRRRFPADSQLDVGKSIKSQFNLLRTVDDKRYPAYFHLNNRKYKIKIEKMNK